MANTPTAAPSIWEQMGNVFTGAVKTGVAVAAGGIATSNVLGGLGGGAAGNSTNTVPAPAAAPAAPKPAADSEPMLLGYPRRYVLAAGGVAAGALVLWFILRKK